MRFANEAVPRSLTATDSEVLVTVPTSELAVFIYINLHSNSYIYICKHIPEIS